MTLLVIHISKLITKQGWILRLLVIKQWSETGSSSIFENHDYHLCIFLKFLPFFSTKVDSWSIFSGVGTQFVQINFEAFGVFSANLSAPILVQSSAVGPLSIRYHSRFFDCLAHPNLSATMATDQKLPLSHLCISYQSLAECHLP